MILDKARRSCLGLPPGAWPRFRWRLPMILSSLLRHLSERSGGPSYELKCCLTKAPRTEGRTVGRDCPAGESGFSTASEIANAQRFPVQTRMTSRRVNVTCGQTLSTCLRWRARRIERWRAFQQPRARARRCSCLRWIACWSLSGRASPGPPRFGCSSQCLEIYCRRRTCLQTADAFEIRRSFSFLPR